MNWFWVSVGHGYFFKACWMILISLDTKRLRPGFYVETKDPNLGHLGT